jgi:FkbM family methyltransferase
MRLVCVEPIAANAEALRRNLALHGIPVRETVDLMKDSVVSEGAEACVFQVAVSDEAKEEASITYYPNMSGNSTLCPTEKELQRALMNPHAVDTYFAGSRCVPCAVTTLSTLIRAAGVKVVDLLKIDVEGAELAALKVPTIHVT